MLDFGWAELFVVMAIAVLVVGPKDIPGAMRGLGRLFRRFQYMKHSLTQQFDDFMNDVDPDGSSVNFEAEKSMPDSHNEFDEAAEDEDVLPAHYKVKEEGSDE